MALHVLVQDLDHNLGQDRNQPVHNLTVKPDTVTMLRVPGCNGVVDGIVGMNGGGRQQVLLLRAGAQEMLNSLFVFRGDGLG
jgi:hypothetical protein